MKLFSHLFNASKALKLSEDDLAFVKESAQKIHKLFNRLDRHLDGKRYLTGERPTIADLQIFSELHLTECVNADWSAYTHVLSWYGRMSAFASVKTVYGPQGAYSMQVKPQL